MKTMCALLSVRYYGRALHLLETTKMQFDTSCIARSTSRTLDWSLSRSSFRTDTRSLDGRKRTWAAGHFSEISTGAGVLFYVREMPLRRRTL